MHKKTLTVLLSLMSMATAQNVTLIGFLPTSFNSIVPPVLDEERNLVYYTEGKFLNIYDFKQQKTFQKLDMSSLIRALALSPDHKTLYVARTLADPSVVAIDTRTWETKPEFKKALLGFDMLLTPLGGQSVLASSKNYETLYRLDATTGAATDNRLPKPLGHLALSADGRSLAVATVGRLQILDAQDLKVQKEFTLPEMYLKFTALGFSPDRRRLAGATSEGEVQIYDTLTRQKVQHLTTKLTDVKGLTFSPNGRYLVVVSGYIVDQLNVFDLTDGQRVPISNDKHQFEWGATFTPDGKTLFVSTDSGVREYDTRELNPMDAQVLMNVDPQDAQITLFGQGISAGSAHNVFSAVPMELQVTKPFYKTFTTTLNLKGGEIKNLNIVLERERGSLTLTSTPRGATVLIDGQEKGKTPLKLSRFDAGEYTVTLKLNDHKEFTQRMILQGGQDAVLNATLVTQPSIKLTSRPTGAQVWMGDQLVCEKTPCTLRNLKPSIQEFTFRLNGFPDLKAKAVIPEEGTTNLDVTLKK